MKIGVIGSGQMGQGIAQTAAQFGFKVCLADQKIEFAQQGLSKIKKQLERQVEKQKITLSDLEKITSSITPVGNFQEMKECEFFIEAASENLEVKKRIFQDLDSYASPGAIFTSNTSSISITELAASTKRPQLFAGMHFMNPVPVMKLVEGIKGLQTSSETFSTVRKIAEAMGKIFIEVRDIPGFAVNRILMPMINEAIFALYEGIASKEDLDQAMKLGTNQPMGPLTLADFIGLDTCLAIMNVMYEGLGDSKYRPCPLLKQYVAAGWLGKKVGKGFYRYE